MANPGDLPEALDNLVQQSSVTKNSVTQNRTTNHPNIDPHLLAFLISDATNQMARGHVEKRPRTTLENGELPFTNMSTSVLEQVPQS